VSKPTLRSASFPHGLHKKKHKPPSSAKLYGTTNVVVGDEVNVNGTRGQRPTTWSGTIAVLHSNGDCDVTDLTVDTEEVSKSSDHRTTAGGSEDVSVTVTNLGDTSDPVTTAAVSTIP
jgi:hypothetical protein